MISIQSQDLLNFSRKNWPRTPGTVLIDSHLLRGQLSSWAISRMVTEKLTWGSLEFLSTSETQLEMTIEVEIAAHCRTLDVYTEMLLLKEIGITILLLSKHRKVTNSNQLS